MSRIKIFFLFLFLFKTCSGLAIQQPTRSIYNDLAEAFARRSAFEHTLLQPREQELLAPDLSSVVISSETSKGAGFSSNSATKKIAMAKEQCKVMKEQGVLRVNNCLTKSTTTIVRKYILETLSESKIAVEAGEISAKELFGVELQRKFRADLLLSFLKNDNDKIHPVAMVFNELLGEKGTLRHVFEELVTKEGELYEMAATVTEPGSDRQQIHPDLPFNKIPPLYVLFVALQDVTVDMGPTTFLIQTNKEETTVLWDDHSKRDDLLAKTTPKLALLKCGDAVIFDARILHCGNANIGSSTRALFNFSFRNPLVCGNLGYPPSIRPGYEGVFKLQDITQLCNQYATNSKKDPFVKYGNGLLY